MRSLHPGMLRGLLLWLVCWLVFALGPGCASSDRDRSWVAHALADRGLTTAGDEDLDAYLEGGVDETEVAPIALAESPRFRSELARIDVGRADLDEAGRIANPQITLAGPIGPVSAIALILAPLESLWQLPARTEAAARALEATAETVVQVGLDVARDARLAHVEAVLARERVAARRELWSLLAELARVADVRAEVGDTSPADAAVARAEERAAADALEAAETAVPVADARLAEQLGLDGERLLGVVYLHEPAPPPPVDELLRAARASRPDLRGAELALRAAAARAGWERTRVVALAAQVDAQWTAPDQFGVRVGGRIELPIFGANPGGIGRADAEVARTAAQIDVAILRVTTEVIEARARLVQALASLATLREEILPRLEEALRIATRSYEVGEEAHFFAIDALRRSADARLRELDLVAEARRAEAELERALGARLESP